MSDPAAVAAAKERKARLYKQICYGLSWHCQVQVQVPPALWALLGHGWPYGPLMKSSGNIQDPDNKTVTWSAWLFAAGMVIVKSSAPQSPFIWLHAIGQEAGFAPGPV